MVFGGYAVTPTSCNTPNNTERVCNWHKPMQANELELVATTKSLRTLQWELRHCFLFEQWRKPRAWCETTYTHIHTRDLGLAASSSFGAEVKIKRKREDGLRKRSQVPSLHPMKRTASPTPSGGRGKWSLCSQKHQADWNCVVLIGWCNEVPSSYS